MSLTLGEKLRKAREEQGISISEIAEQTRISPHYLECIEKNDFKTLPGGIFNKGFVKSFARYVGVNEAEAVQDYVLALGEADGQDSDAPRPYHPEVLTDDRTRSMIPTILFAVVILALMTGGILFVVRYLLSPSTAANQVATSTSAPANSAVNANSANANPTVPLATDKISVELKAVSEPVWVSYSVDGNPKIQTLAPDESVKLDANDAVRISYSKAKLPNLQITLNGRSITPPTSDTKGKIEFEINKSNMSAMVQTGQTAAPPAATPLPETTASPDEPKRTPQPERSKTPRPSPTPTPSGTPKPKPSPTIIIVGPSRPRTTPTNRSN